MGIKCPNCGAINNDQVTTCEYCGTALNVQGNTKSNSLAQSQADITNELSNSINSTSLEYRDQGKVALLLIVTCGFTILYYLGTG